MRIKMDDMNWSSQKTNLVNLTIHSNCLKGGSIHFTKTFKLEHKFDVVPEVLTDVTTYRHTYNASKIKFYHWYQFTNQGPSQTNLKLPFKIYVPISHLISLEDISTTSSDDELCNMDRPLSASRFYQDGMPQHDESSLVYSNVLSCSTIECYAYQCHLPEGFQRLNGLFLDISL